MSCTSNCCSDGTTLNTQICMFYLQQKRSVAIWWHTLRLKLMKPICKPLNKLEYTAHQPKIKTHFLFWFVKSDHFGDVTVPFVIFLFTSFSLFVCNKPRFLSESKRPPSSMLMFGWVSAGVWMYMLCHLGIESVVMMRVRHRNTPSTELFTNPPLKNRKIIKN